MKLDREFYRREALTVARELIGKKITCRIGEDTTGGIIVETEAYMGAIDAASHAFKNRRTQRTETMFGDGGHLYVYLIYGMYHCLNVVTNVIDVPECVLIRALEPTDGIEIMKRRRKTQVLKNLCSGPGKLTQALGIDKTFNNTDLCSEKFSDLYSVDSCKEDVPELCNTLCRTEVFIETTDLNFEIETTKRINIDYAGEAADYLWRFVTSDLMTSRK